MRDPRLARLEAVLLMAREPLSSRKLAQFTSLADGTEARTLIRVLNRFYQQQATAFRVEEVAGGFQLFARPQFGPWLRRLFQAPVEFRLSNPALETLAVVAYRQPVLRADVEAIRGVQSGEILRQLMERDLVRIVGRSTELGRPFLYGTTKLFLRIFGLRHLDDLPRAASLRPTAVASAVLQEISPGGSGDLDITSQRHEESDVRITALLEPESEVLDRSKKAWQHASQGPMAAKDEDEDMDDDDMDDEEDDLEDEEDDLDDDLEEEEWEEVDDEDEEEDDLEDDDEEWEDDDEDDDWDDDEEEWDEDDEE
jgi:segregation and condensation protein B